MESPPRYCLNQQTLNNKGMLELPFGSKNNTSMIDKYMKEAMKQYHKEENANVLQYHTHQTYKDVDIYDLLHQAHKKKEAFDLQMENDKQMVNAKIQQFQSIYGSRQDDLTYLNSHNHCNVGELTKLKELLNLKIAVIDTLLIHEAPQYLSIKYIISILEQDLNTRLNSKA